MSQVHDDTLLAALASFLTRDDLATILGVFGGRRQFLPSLQSFNRSERERAVLQGWRDGNDYETLASQHGICARTVRRIVAKGRPNTP